MDGQRQKIFFDFTESREHPELPERPSDNEVRAMLSENNANCPLNEVIVSEQNEGNMRILRRFAYSAYRRFNRSCRGCNFGIYSLPGHGKTFIVKKFAETIGLPFIFISSPVLDSVSLLFEMIKDEFDKSDTPLVERNNEEFNYIIPPCIVFFDEAHKLKSSLMKGALLNAMEPDDGKMSFALGNKVVHVDCYNICWVAATTDKGDLFDAFETRLTTSIEWSPATGSDLARIVKFGLDKKIRNREISISPPLEICELITKYQSVPRLAINNFGLKVVQHKEFIPSCTWEECCVSVANDLGLNRYGLNKQQMNILTAIGERPVAESRLVLIANCRLSQIQRYELPALLTKRGDFGPLAVSLPGRGITITQKGIDLLNALSIKNNGVKATAEYLESK